MVAYPVEHDAALGTARFRSKPVSAVQRREACAIAMESVVALGAGSSSWGASPLAPAPARERRASGALPHDAVSSSSSGDATSLGLTARVLCWHPSAVASTRFYSVVLVSRPGSATGGTGAASGRPSVLGPGQQPSEVSPTRYGSSGSGAGRVKPRRTSTSSESAPLRPASWVVVQTWEIEQPGGAPTPYRRTGFGSLLVSQACTATEGAGAQGEALVAPWTTPDPVPALTTWVSVVLVSPDCVPGLSSVEAAALFTGRCAVRLSPTSVTVFPRERQAGGEAGGGGGGVHAHPPSPGLAIHIPLAAVAVCADGEESIGSVARSAAVPSPVDLAHVSATIPFTRYRSGRGSVPPFLPLGLCVGICCTFTVIVCHGAALQCPQVSPGVLSGW